VYGWGIVAIWVLQKTLLLSIHKDLSMEQISTIIIPKFGNPSNESIINLKVVVNHPANLSLISSRLNQFNDSPPICNSFETFYGRQVIL